MSESYLLLACNDTLRLFVSTPPRESNMFVQVSHDRGECMANVHQTWGQSRVIKTNKSYSMIHQCIPNTGVASKQTVLTEMFCQNELWSRLAARYQATVYGISDCQRSSELMLHATGRYKFPYKRLAPGLEGLCCSLAHQD